MAAEALFRIRYQTGPSGGMIELGIEAIDGRATIVLADDQWNGYDLVDGAGTVMEILDTEKAAICREVEKVVWPWIESGVVKPVIDRVMPMQDAAEAHRLLASGPVTGKIVLQAP
jgi:NADPH:quinone reductase-like Zn-dependent oxidoreductase